MSLDTIDVQTPCPASWDAMTGDDRTRFCRQCKLNVYNLSEMTREEAERLIMEKEGRLCARFFRREDGTILTRDCSPIRARRARRAFALALGFCLLFVTQVLAYASYLTSRRSKRTEPFGRYPSWSGMLSEENIAKMKRTALYDGYAPYKAVLDLAEASLYPPTPFFGRRQNPCVGKVIRMPILPRTPPPPVAKSIPSSTNGGGQ